MAHYHTSVAAPQMGIVGKVGNCFRFTFNTSQRCTELLYFVISTFLFVSNKSIIYTLVCGRSHRSFMRGRVHATQMFLQLSTTNRQFITCILLDTRRILEPYQAMTPLNPSPNTFSAFIYKALCYIQMWICCFFFYSNPPDIC